MGLNALDLVVIVVYLAGVTLFGCASVAGTANSERIFPGGQRHPLVGDFALHRRG